MMILNPLLLFFIPSLLCSLSITTVNAVPIPVGDTHASSHTHTPPTSAQPKLGLNNHDHPVRHPPIQHGQPTVVGHMPAHPDLKAGMNHQQLDEHARHIAANLPPSPHPWVVHAKHTPGHQSVPFKAHQDPQHRWAEHPEGHLETAHHTMHVPQNRRPHVDTPTLHDHERDAMHNKLVDAHRAGHHTANHVAPHPNGHHGQGVEGRLAVDPAHQHSGLTDDHLKVHANFVAKNIIRHPQDHDMQIRVSHKPGDTHATYHAVTAPGGVINHHAPPTQQEKNAIHAHVNGLFQAGTAHHGGSVNGHGNPPTFSGGIPAHPGASHHMSPGHMKEYSAAIANGLQQKYGLSHEEKNKLAVASLHAPGSNHILFDTQPRHADVFRSGANLHPDLRAAHQSVGHVLSDDGTTPKVHSDSKVVNRHLQSVGAAPGTAHQHLQGVSVGVSGQGDQPCSNCHNVLSQFPVHYEGRNRPVHPNVQRAIDL